MGTGMDRLSETYWELQADENPIGLEEFVGRVAAEEYGPVTKAELREFLRGGPRGADRRDPRLDRGPDHQVLRRVRGAERCALGV